MKDSRPDDERLAALLDGRLAGPERDALLAHLAEHDEDYHLFLETADILREAEEDAPEDAGGPQRKGAEPLPPLPPRRGRWPRRATRWAALAAGLAGLALGAVLGTRGWSAEADHPVRLAARLEQAGPGLPEGWTGERPWGATRGGGVPAGEGGAAARGGALLLDLAVAVEAGDSAATRLLAAQLRQRFDPRATASSPLPRIESGAGAPAGALAPLVREATARLEDRLGRGPLRAGAWTQAARLAARRRDEAFFHARSTAGGLRRAERHGGGEAASRVRVLLAARGERDWDALTAALDELLAALAD